MWGQSKMAATLGAGLLLGLVVGLLNDRSTRLCLEGVLQEGGRIPYSLLAWLTLIFFLVKHTVIWSLVYLLLISFHLNLLGFAVGVLMYQTYRIAYMVSYPRLYAGRRYGQ